MSKVRHSLAKLWMRLLKASVKGKDAKAKRLEKKIIALELELKNVNG
jgi:hypothetical protein